MKSLFSSGYKKGLLSFWAIILLVVITGNFGNNFARWDKNEVINNDAIIYYAYFPATFIYHDWKFEFADKMPEGFEGRIWTLNTPDRKKVLKMTMGLSMLWLPFETVAHVYAKNSDYKADGYSKPYSIAIFVAALFYLFWGLWFLRKLLLKYFSDITVAITLILVVAGTNLMHYIIWEPGMSHVYNFFLITAFLFLTIRWLENPTWLDAILLGLVTGLIVLIRPVNGVVVLLPVLWGVSSIIDLNSRLKLFLKNWKFILLIGIISLCILLPQLFYWKIATGHWLYYSYQDEKFFFNHPHIINGLFSYRKGWFVYTPIMGIAFVGFIMLHRYLKKANVALLVTMAVAIYIIYSWWAWWYGGSYSSRPMIDFYGLMAFPLAALLQYTIKLKIWAKASIITVFAAFVWLNQFQMTQYRTSLLHWDSMTKKAYWNILLKKNWPEGYDKMIQTPDYEKAKKGIDEY